MSAPISNETDQRVLPIPTMYAPPWARETWAREEAREAAVAATDAALAASEEFRRTLPPAPLLSERRLRDAPFEGDVAIARLRERPSLDPVVMPPPADDGASAGLFARIAGAIGLAALALGMSYDTANLSRLGARGIAPDAAQARAWYAKAAEFGSGEASRRLEQFAQSDR